MGERPTLLMTTRLGVRPLGVRGEPLHAVAGQLLSVIRRRLGDGPADLLADLESRQDEVLRLLADLEARTARALAEVVAAAKVLNAEEPAAAPSAQPLNPSKLRAA